MDALLYYCYKFTRLKKNNNKTCNTESFISGAQSPHVTIMRRMSDMLTRWLDPLARQEESAEGMGLPPRRASSTIAEGGQSVEGTGPAAEDRRGTGEYFEFQYSK